MSCILVIAVRRSPRKESQVVDSRGTDRSLVGGGEQPTFKPNTLYKVQSALCATLHSVITNVSTLAIFPTVLSFLHSYVINRNEFRYADSGLFRHPAT